MKRDASAMTTQSSAPRDGKYRYGSDIIRRLSNLESENAELAEANKQLRADLQRLQKLAYLDPLTGLANRRYFASRIDSELRRATRAHSPTALIICDIDEFKRYNDRYGHCGGDAVLIAVGTALRRFCRRGGDLAIRHGGDEFALILPDVQAKAVRNICEEIRRSVKSISIGNQIHERITVSIGAAVFHRHAACSAATFIQIADRALHRAKRHIGKDCVKVNVLDDRAVILKSTP